MTIIGMMMINLLGGMKVIKNERLKKHKIKKNFYQLPGIHQDTGIGVCQKTRRGGRSNR